MNGETTIKIEPKESPSEAHSTDSKLLANEFIINLKVYGLSSGGRDEQNYVGMLINAKAGLDVTDYLEAPAITKNLKLSIIEDDKNYAGNFIYPSAKGAIWDLELTPGGIKENYKLYFEGYKSLPADYKIWLWDLTQSAPREVVNGEILLNNVDNKGTRKLKLIIGTEEFVEDHKQENKILPEKFVLEQNFPNPFNPTTTIRYVIPSEQAVTIKIYNILGEEIIALFESSKKTAGFHTVNWNGTNKLGHIMPSGIYLYSLETKSFKTMKKMILMK